MRVDNIWLGFDQLGVDDWIRWVWSGWALMLIAIFGVAEFKKQTASSGGGGGDGDDQVKSSGTCIVKLDRNIVRSHIDCSYSYI